MADQRIWECFNLVTINDKDYNYEALMNSPYGDLLITIKEAYMIHSGYSIERSVKGSLIKISINFEAKCPTEECD